MKLPSTKVSIETLEAKQEAVDMVENLITRNMDLEDIFQVLQPLLYELSVKLYGDDASEKSLQQIVEDGVKLLKGEEDGKTTEEGN